MPNRPRWTLRSSAALAVWRRGSERPTTRQRAIDGWISCTSWPFRRRGSAPDLRRWYRHEPYARALPSRGQAGHAPNVEPIRPDHYRVLQVDPAANPLVIQAAYRVLARIFHPDMDGDDEQMKPINEAWHVLGDPHRRTQYDIERAGRHAGPAQPAAPPHAATTRSWGASNAAARATRNDDGAGPPRGEPFGPVLTFGRYAGWTVGQVAGVDRPFLEWLKRAPAGRALREDIEAVLRTRRGPGAVSERRHYETNQARVHSWAPGAPTRVR